MHCLGAGAGGQVSPNGFSSRGSVLNVVRALGVLVCEGRIQGPPRGYKEGPHCVPPLQSAPNNHVCEKDNYLCDRYLVLVREITERVSIGSYLCVEVVLCSDCPCGAKKSKSKHRVLSVPPTTSWQNTSEMLLEYWCIGIVASKSPETMNAQGLYQAVRSRLHFSQVAAWWSRTSGARPSYVATRIAPQSPGDDHLKRFRETPTEHTFPLAGIGDGNSIKVTMWALPRMEDTPRLLCPMHPQPAPEAELSTGSCARASTPTKLLIPTTAVPNSGSANAASPPVGEGLLLPALLDDRLQIACDKPGKHHCRCADEEDDVEDAPASTGPASQALARPNGERKRRRSLPCRPPDLSAGSATASEHGAEHSPLPALSETAPLATQSKQSAASSYESTATTATLDGLERSFRTQLSIEEQQERCEKRYKRADGAYDKEQNGTTDTIAPWISYSANGNTISAGLPLSSQINNNNSSPNRNTVNLVLNPLCCEPESVEPKIEKKQQQQQQDWLKVNASTGPLLANNRDLSQLMSKVSLSQEKEPAAAPSKTEQTGSILDWISRVPGRVLGAGISETVTSATAMTTTVPTTPPKNEAKMCNLELSAREFDEVLAVLRSRTPLGRRRAALRTAKRREKYDRLINETSQQHQQNGKSGDPAVDTDRCNASNKADVLLGAILRTTSRENKKELPNGTKSSPRSDASTTDEGSNCTENGNTADESSLPSALNKRLSRIRQLFKRDQEGNNGQTNSHRESRAKRRIDFTDLDDAVEKKGQDEEDEANSHCNSAVGTSTNSAHVNSIFHSTNSEQRSTSCCPELRQEQRRQRMECSAKDKTPSKSKTRGKREFSPIWVNQNNNHVGEVILNGVSEEGEKEAGNVSSETCDKTVVPTVKDQERFRRSLENAASMVFHSRTGLPLTSSPAPLRRGSCCFDFDSSLNSVSSKRSALFELNTPPSPGAVSLEEGDREIENACDIEETTRRRSTSRNRPQSHALLGSFEESALNGRLEPVSTVHGFTAEIGASGSFCPKHRKLPVTVFFYTFGDHEKVSSPYLAHINLGKKGYQVPRMGTIQVTLLNPLGTVIKMFVVLYDLTDMPARSHTFLRQRTLRDKTLRYLIHLRFMSGKSGRIYLHTDIRMIICRKSDVDTASDFASEPPKELRSYIHGPTNPKFSPRC